MNFRIKFNLKLVLFLIAILYFPISIILYFAIDGLSSSILLGNLVSLAYIIYFNSDQSKYHIDLILSDFTGDVSIYDFYNLKYPSYKFVDIYNAVDLLCEEYLDVYRLKSTHNETLPDLIKGNFMYEGDGAIQQPEMLSWQVDYNDEKFFPQEQFWVIKGKNVKGVKGDKLPENSIIFRLYFYPAGGECVLEFACADEALAEAIKNKINQLSKEKSIYKNKLLELRFENEIKDEYGDVDQAGQAKINFKKIEEVTKEDIILEPRIESIIQRNVFDFHENQDLLRQFGIPSKKAMLFYGPPGTGKTFTCQYIYSNLKDITAIVVTGNSLINVRSICNLAHVLQPALVILEDVDLVFSSREINLYSSTLGDFMDELDGFQKNDKIMFILTTNDIDRLEKAIKDRPGRISQCIFFGAPNEELRKRYIKKYISVYKHGNFDLDDLVVKTKGTTQAFIKELVLRAVHVAVEDTHFQTEEVDLNNSHFDRALEEMIQYDNNSAHLIMGFKNDIL